MSAVLPLRQEVPRGARTSRACSRPRSSWPSTTRRSTRSRSQGITESEDPTVDTRLYISNENVLEGLRLVHDRREGRRATRSAASKAKKVQEEGQGVARVSGLVNARRLGEDMAVLAAARLKKCRSTSPSTARPARATSTRRRAIYSIARRAGQDPPRVPDRDLDRRARRVLRRPGHDLEGPAAPGQPRPGPRARTAASCCCSTTARSCAGSPGDAARRLLGHEHDRPQDLQHAHDRDRLVIEATELLSVQPRDLSRRVAGLECALMRFSSPRFCCCSACSPPPPPPPRPARAPIPARTPASASSASAPGGVLRFPQASAVGPGRLDLRRRPVHARDPGLRARRRASCASSAPGSGPGGLTSVGAVAVAADGTRLRRRRLGPDRALRRRRDVAELVRLQRQRRRGSSTSAPAAATTRARAAGSRSARTGRSTSPTRATTASSASPPTAPAGR